LIEQRSDQQDDDSRERSLVVQELVRVQAKILLTDFDKNLIEGSGEETENTIEQTPDWRQAKKGKEDEMRGEE
jgi:hypothetical protein